MYSEFRSPSGVSCREYDWSRATAHAIDLAILSGLFLAPRRVVLEMAAKPKQQTEKAAVKEEEMELLKAA